jgi:uncharacterized protein
MTDNEVNELAKEGSAEGKPLRGNVVDTHISWVIITDDFAYKIKKPIKLSFLDYTSLGARKENCEKEIVLNSRYSKIYLSVVPIKFHKKEWVIGGKEGDLIDYAVKMKRMDSSRQMDKMLQNSNANISTMKPLAEKIGSFHAQAKITHHPFKLPEAILLFNDLEQVIELVNKELGVSFQNIIAKSIVWSDEFLTHHQSRLKERVEKGFQRDVHGDLHSGNIFLYDMPVLFDGIEFNETFRQIDLLYEIAFLCMDLEAYDRPDLANSFLEHYNEIVPCFEIEEDYSIFNYYKCLRANIRAKVHALSAEQVQQEKSKSYHLDEAKKYLILIDRYINCSLSSFMI